MQQREPLLYERYIGRYKTEQEKNMPYGNDVGLVQRILTNIDRGYAEEKAKEQREIEEEQFEEEEEEDEDEEEEEKDVIMKEASPRQIPKTPVETFPEEKHEPLTDKHIQDMLPNQRNDTPMPDVQDLQFREEQRLEFIRILEEKFLSGQDVSLLLWKQDMSKVTFNDRNLG